MNSTLERDFVYLVISEKLPRPVPEYKFCATRRWRFDFAWPDKMIAVELEGGIWILGRHNRPRGMIADMVKYNTATRMGWRVFRCSKENMGKTIEQIKQLMGKS